jgi:Cupin-like domain
MKVHDDCNVVNNHSSTDDTCKNSNDAITAIAARVFFERYVARRRPCVLQQQKQTPHGSLKGNHDQQQPAPDDNVQNNCIGRMEYDHREWFPQAANVIAILTHWLQQKPEHELMVQVERRTCVRERFGQARSSDRQVTLPLSTLVRHFLQIKPNIPNPHYPKKERNDGSNSSAAATAAAATAASSLALLEANPSLYYLSTQDDVRDTQSDEDAVVPDSRPPEPYWSEPCRRLREAHLLPSCLPLAGHLMLHQCQVWMGSCTNTTKTGTTVVSHSGLHHDYHDNFYTVLAGCKEFILYPPSDAPLLAVAGDIHTIHANGLLSYQTAPIYADGRPVQVEQKDNNTDCEVAIESCPKRPRTRSNEPTESEEDDDDDDDEEEVVLGRGFDYQSDSDDDDDDHVDWNNTMRDDFDEINRDEKEANDHDATTTTKDNGGDVLPNHFSRLDPTLPGNVPAAATEYRVRLYTGDTLYLPASWFHCVVSHASTASDEKEDAADDWNQAASANHHTTATATESKTTSSLDDVQEGTHTTESRRGAALPSTTETSRDIAIPPELHMAVNYWYHPPDNLDDYQHPYRDRAYWESNCRTESVETLGERGGLKSHTSCSK